MKSAYLSSVICLILIAAVGCGNGQTQSDSEGGSPSKTIRVAMIPKGSTHVFWKSVHAGGVKAERELRAEGTEIELIWKGPLGEGDRSNQISVVENFMTQGVDAICLAPLDEIALVAPVQKALRAGISVFVFDSGLKSDKVTSFVATDNFKGGQIAGDHLAKLLDGNGKVILLRYMEGSASTDKRERGFLDAIEKHAGIEVISDNIFAGNSRATAQVASENLLNRFGDQVNGIFCPNESSTVGMVLALKSIGKAGGKVKLVGFDSGDQCVQALRDDDLQALVLQDPVNMGYLSVKMAVQHVQGGKVDERIDTGSTLVTKDNMDDPDLQALIHPPLDEFLD